MLVESGALKIFPVPGVTQMYRPELKINVVESCTSHILLRPFIKNDEGEFCLPVASGRRNMQIVLEVFRTVGTHQRILPNIRLIDRKRQQVIEIRFVKRSQLYDIVFENQCLVEVEIHVFNFVWSRNFVIGTSKYL